jgi:peptide/nickel transport system substrate-binding protein
MPEHKRFVLHLLMMMILAGTAACKKVPQTVVPTVEVTVPAPIIDGVTITPTPTDDKPVNPDLPAMERSICAPLPDMPVPSESAAAVPAAFRAAVPANANPIRLNGARIAPVDQSGKIYRVGVFEDISTLNLWEANGPQETTWNSYMLPPRLSMYRLSERTSQLVPAVAADPVPPDFTEVHRKFVTEIRLRDDIRWSDGTPLTAADVAFTASTALRFGPIYGNWYGWFDPTYLESVEAVDATTVRYTYHTKPGWALHEYGTLQAPILQAAFWQSLVDEAYAPLDALAADADESDLAEAQEEATEALFAIDPSGEPLAGAFLLKVWTEGESLENIANPDYYDQGATFTTYEDGSLQYDGVGDAYDFTLYGDGAGEPAASWTVGPNVGSVVYTIYGSQNAAILALQDGDIDYILNALGLQRALVDGIRSDPNLTVVENRRYDFRYLNFNMHRLPMYDCAFRQAVAVLIDREFIAQDILQGAAYPQYSFVPDSNTGWYWDEAPHTGEGLTREQRINLAMQILENAGFSWEGDVKPTWDAQTRQVIPGGPLLLPTKYAIYFDMPEGTAVPVPNLNIYSPGYGLDPLRSTFADWIDTWLNELGTPVHTFHMAFTHILPGTTLEDFDMYLLGWWNLGIFPDYLNDFFNSEQAVDDGNNWGGYINPDFDTIGERLLTCRSYEACKDAADEAQRILSTELPYIILFDAGIVEVYRSAGVEYPFTEQVNGLQFSHQGGVLQSEVTIK